MNALFRLRKDMQITALVPFKYLLYTALLSDVTTYVSGDDRLGIFAKPLDDLDDYFSDWSHSDERRNVVTSALNELERDGLIYFLDDSDGEQLIVLGEYRGRKFFTFERRSSFCDIALKTFDEELSKYGNSKSVKDRSRAKYIRSTFERLISEGIDKLGPGAFTEIHGYLYEIYTGGEVYTLRNEAEKFQTKNILKAYDRFTTLAILIEATLHYDKYRSKGLPTLVNVAYIKDDVFKAFTKADSGSKDYMRDITSVTTDDSDF